MSTIHRFVIQESNGVISCILNDTAEHSPYRDLPEFFSFGGSNRTDQGWEGESGWQRFYLHSKINLVDNDLRLLILFSPERVGDKELLSETLDTKCLKLVAQDYSNLQWWMDLEKSFVERRRAHLTTQQ